METKNEKYAKTLLKAFNMQEPICEKCIFYGGSTDGFARCTNAPALATQRFIHILRADKDKQNVPYFPVVGFLDEDGSEIEIAAIVAHETGILIDEMAWPDHYNPRFLLFCLFFMTKDQVDALDNIEIN